MTDQLREALAELDAIGERTFGPTSDQGSTGPAAGADAGEGLVGMFRQVGMSEAKAQEWARTLETQPGWTFDEACAQEMWQDPRFRVRADLRLIESIDRSLSAGRTILGERRSTTTLTRPAVREAGQATRTGGGALSVCLIDAGWGSSGYYSPQVLEAAAGAKVFAAGTQMFLDHPGAGEEYDRPERSVRDLAGKLTSDAWYDPTLKGLRATAEVYPAAAAALEGMLGDIGLSVRAYASVEPGEAEGRKGLLITAFEQAISVDFVTQAGRGGRVL